MLQSMKHSFFFFQIQEGALGGNCIESVLYLFLISIFLLFIKEHLDQIFMETCWDKLVKCWASLFTITEVWAVFSFSFFLQFMFIST